MSVVRLSKLVVLLFVLSRALACCRFTFTTNNTLLKSQWLALLLYLCFYFEGQAEVAFVTRIRQLVQPVKRGSGGALLLVFALRLKHLAAGRSETNNLPFKRRGRACGGAQNHGKCSSVASERSTRILPGLVQRIITRHEVRRFDGLFRRDVTTKNIKNT